MNHKDVAEIISSNGWAVLPKADFDDLIEKWLIFIGDPIHVFRRQPFWKTIGVDLLRPPTRSGGIGHNSLHIDCVNMSRPPDFVALHCVRSDPLNGGASLVADMTCLESSLSAEAIIQLRMQQFSDGASFDLDHVGIEVTPFAVLNYDESRTGRYRWTGRLLESPNLPEVLAALREADDKLARCAQRIFLKAGETLIVDQSRIAHGRECLGPGQERVSADNRRLLVQCFLRRKELSGR